jgi:cyclopropane fatty-acyl-phospholipid synthase-like methyltransferase
LPNNSLEEDMVVKGPPNKNQQPDFGRYHHSTQRGSEKIREKIEVLFTEALGDLPFSRDDEPKILDIGCGLGFLSWICAKYYPNGMITGIDTFQHASLKNSSLAKARNNMKILGFSERIRFQKGDIFSSDYNKRKFDLFVSNLVFHNFGRKRFNAYERLAQWATPKSYIVLGDLFFDYKKDSKLLTSLFGSVQVRPGSIIDRAYKILVLSEPKK